MPKRTSILALVLGLSFFALPGLAEETPAPAGAKLYFIGLADGDTVSSPVVVRFGLSGMGVAPAGTEKEGTGHHHLIVDAELPNLDEPIPSDENYRHFGKGQTRPLSSCPPAPTRCSCCWATTTTSRTTRRSPRSGSRSP